MHAFWLEDQYHLLHPILYRTVGEYSMSMVELGINNKTLMWGRLCLNCLRSFSSAICNSDEQIDNFNVACWLPVFLNHFDYRTSFAFCSLEKTGYFAVEIWFLCNWIVCINHIKAMYTCKQHSECIQMNWPQSDPFSSGKWNALF